MNSCILCSSSADFLKKDDTLLSVKFQTDRIVLMEVTGMKSSKRTMKKALSILLSAAMTAGFLSATGFIAAAETIPAESGKETEFNAESNSATASDAELLDEEGFLLDGDISDDLFTDPELAGDAETATRSNVLRAPAKREKKPQLVPYFDTSSRERLYIRLYGRNFEWGSDEVYYSFITREEWNQIYLGLNTTTDLWDILFKEERRTRYDMENKPPISIPEYLSSIGLEKTPGTFYFWVENKKYPEPRNVQCYCSLEYEGNLPRIIAKFEDGNEAWSGSVEKGTKIRLETDETYYGDTDYEIRYTINGTYPNSSIDAGVFPSELFAEKDNIYTYDPESPLVIEEDTILRAVAVPVKDGEPVELPEGFNAWIVGTWHFQVFTGKADMYEPNDSRTDAFRVDFPTQIMASVHSDSDHDFYSFTNGSFGALYLTLTPVPYCAYGLRLLDEKGEILKECVLKPEKAGQMGFSQTILYSGPDGAGLPKDQWFTAEVWSLNETYNEELSYTLRMVPTVYASAGKLAVFPDFSELDMALAVHGLYEGEQTDYTGLDTRNVSRGGNLWKQLSYLSQWYGPVDEDLQPYPKEAYSPNPADRPVSYKYKDHSSSAKYHLQNAVIGLAPEDGDEAYRNSIKNMVYTYGACVITYDASSEAANDEFQASDGTIYRPYSFYYDNRPRDDKEAASPHKVTVVGWDDDLPKELFSHSRGTQWQQFGEPQNNGGFLVKNSWGTDFGIDGFLWISYEATSLMQDARGQGTGAAAFLMEKAGQYDRQYLNDTTSISEIRYAETVQRYMTYGSGSVEAGNVFTADDNDQLLTAVSLVVLDPAVNYDIWLTANGETKKILSGCEQNAGYYTKRLSEPVLIKAGTTFTLTEVLYADGGQELAFPYGKGRIDEGLSFCVDRKTGKLVDMSEEGFYPCLRAFTVIPGYTGKPKRICRTTLNENYGQTASRDTDYVFSEYAAEAIEKNSLENTLVSSAAESAATVSDLPAAYDARDYGLVTTVKRQGQFGTCWAFSAMAALESNVLLNGGTRMEYARTIDASSPDSEVHLTKDMQTYTVRGTAKLNAENAYSGDIFWSYSGDTDSIEILCTCSYSGSEAELFRFIKPGKVTARAVSGADIGLSAELEFTADVQEIESISLEKKSYEMKAGEELQLEPKIAPEDIWDSTILYSSSDPTVAYVDGNGKITALKAGTATITLKGGSKVLEVIITVVGNPKPDERSSDDSSEDSSGGSSGGSSRSSAGARGKAGAAETPGSWKLTEAGWTFLLADGTAAKDLWILKGGKWYYTGADGIMRTGWLLDKGKWYYLAPGNGDMQTGLITESGYQYYLSPEDGHMLTGTVQVPGFAEPLHFNEAFPPAPTYVQDPLSGIWKRNDVDALPYGAHT